MPFDNQSRCPGQREASRNLKDKVRNWSPETGRCWSCDDWTIPCMKCSSLSEAFNMGKKRMAEELSVFIEPLFREGGGDG